MLLSHHELRTLFKEFWESKRHVLNPPISLIPSSDPTTLFTSAGMQPLIPNLMGEPHPKGKRLYNIQPCFRSQDIEEVGDHCHTTFFEMMGNWSLGDYFKEKQLEWVFEFFTKKLHLEKEKLFVSVFEGTKNIPQDTESENIWKKLGVAEDRIFHYGVAHNWWSRSGTPDHMPADEIGGPDSEVFYDFGEAYSCGNNCQPNCQCGRFLEIGNSVFIEYKKKSDGTLEKLSQKSVDFGSGLERILSSSNNHRDIFETELYSPIITTLEKHSGKSYRDEKTKVAMRIIADHFKASVFMASEGLKPTNKQQGYVMRRLIRRAAVKLADIEVNPEKIVSEICSNIIDIYHEEYFQKKSAEEIIKVIENEIRSFSKTLEKSMKLLSSGNITGKFLFDLRQSYGLPYEIAIEQLKKLGKNVDEKKLKKEFEIQFEKHQELSRTTSSSMFKGGLADQAKKTVLYHTATHLLHQALIDVFGSEIRQEGSNITAERLRFDFFSSKKPEDKEIKNIESMVNEKIAMGLMVSKEELPISEALKSGAKAQFKQKYPNIVTVYSIGNYSKELCGGPHIENTKEISPISIYKWEKIGNNLYRIYAK